MFQRSGFLTMYQLRLNEVILCPAAGRLLQPLHMVAPWTFQGRNTEELRESGTRIQAQIVGALTVKALRIVKQLPK